MKNARRILGVESEILPLCFHRGPDGSVQFFDHMKFAGLQETLADGFMKYIFRHCGESYDQSFSAFRMFHPANGCFFYPDRGLLEATTPECTSPRQVIAYEIFIKRFLSTIIDEINCEYAEECLQEVTLSHTTGEFPADRPVIFGNCDFTRGTHENYSMDVSKDRKDCASMHEWTRIHGDILASFFVPRQLLCGNGAIYAKEDAFMLSQRSLFITNFISDSSCSRRPLLHQKEDPLSDARYRRFHFIGGDANFAEWSIFLKMGLTSLMLSMVEDEFLIGDKADRVMIVDERLLGDGRVAALHAVCRDITGKKPITLRGPRGSTKTITSLDLMIQWIELMKEYGRYAELTDWDKETIAKAEYCLVAIERGEIDILNDKLDWAIKRFYLRHYMRRNNIESLRDPRVIMFEEQYHDLRRDRGFFLKLQGRGRVARIITPEEEAYAVENPSSTRALWRKIITKELRAVRERLGISDVLERQEWQSVTLGCVQVEYRDPFAERLDEILAYQIPLIRSLTSDLIVDGISRVSGGGIKFFWISEPPQL